MHPTLRYSLLFVASAAVTFAWVQWKVPPVPASHSGAGELLADAGTTTGAAAAPASSQPGRIVVPDADETAREQVRQQARRALAATDPQEILEAMQGMTKVVTPESLEALSHLMYHPQVHLEAVRTLGELAKNTRDGNGRIVKILRAAAEGGGLATETLELADETAVRVQESLDEAGG